MDSSDKFRKNVRYASARSEEEVIVKQTKIHLSFIILIRVRLRTTIRAHQTYVLVHLMGGVSSDIIYVVGRKVCPSPVHPVVPP